MKNLTRQVIRNYSALLIVVGMSFASASIGNAQQNDLPLPLVPPAEFDSNGQQIDRIAILPSDEKSGHGDSGHDPDHVFGEDEVQVWHPPHEDPTPLWKAIETVTDAVTAPNDHLAELFGGLVGMEHFHFETDLSDEVIGIQPTPDRPELIFEWGEGFLKPGFLDQGIELRTGAVWRPSIWVFGGYRANFARRSEPGGPRFFEFAHRLDLFAQLNLSGTERIVVGMRPLDEEIFNPAGMGRLGREFNGYDFQNGDWIDGWNADFQTAFFEGDFGEVFPNLDYWDSKQLDFGFSAGRMAILAQQGLLINEDLIDAVTVTRNTISGRGNLNLRMTGVYAFNNVTRNDTAFRAIYDDESRLYALLTESDFASSTVNADIVYVETDNAAIGDVVVWGVSAIQRVHGHHHHYNTSFHFLGSHPTGDETATAGQGELLVARTSWTPHHGLDSIYVNAFWGIDEFTSAARGPLMGGPLGGSVGILFAATGLGRYGPAISNNVANSYGGAIGYQLQFDGTRKQVIVELGVRDDTDSGSGTGAIAGGIRYRQAIGQHLIWQLDGFVGSRESVGLSDGLRAEIQVKF